MSDELTHLDDQGRARMVDVGAKPTTAREAVASASLYVQPATLRALRSGTTPKGDVLAAARIAGIQAAKRTPELIPLCHAIQLTSVGIAFSLEEADAAKDLRKVSGRARSVAEDPAACIRIVATARASDRTGVEMEALVAASVAALTLYDMLKAIDCGMVIEHLQLERKSGGRSSDWTRA